MTELKWEGPIEDWRIDWATYGGPYIRYPGWPHPENGHTIAKLCFADPTPFEQKKRRTSLVSAAPDLYEALRAVLETRGRPMREEYVDGGTSYHLARAAFERAQAALAKADGNELVAMREGK